MKIFNKTLAFAQSIVPTFQRFPIAILLLCIVAFCFFSMLHEYDSSDIWIHITYASISTFFLSIGAYLFAERQKTSSIKAILLQLGCLLFGGILYFYAQKSIDTPEYFLQVSLTTVGIG